MTTQIRPASGATPANTTMATWAGAIARALSARGLDDRALFRAAEIDYALVNNPTQRIPVSQMTRLWQMAVADSGDPAFGLQVAEHVNITTFYSLGVAAMASANVTQAADMVCRFAALVSDGIDMQLRDSDEEFGLVLAMRPGFPRFADACVEAVMASVMRTARQLLGDMASPSRVSFQHRGQGDVQRYRTFFNCPVTFSAAEDGIHVLRDLLPSGELPSSSPQVAQANAALCEQYLATRYGGVVSRQVSDQLLTRLRRGDSVTLAAVARALAMSERKLQSQLRAEETVFRELLDDVRAQLAQQLLQDRSESVARIAEQLGFESPSSFTRAYRRWHGVSPRQARRDGN